MILALASDLIFASRIEGVARPLGIAVRTVRTAPAALAELGAARALLVDLHASGEPLELVRAARQARPDLPVVAFVAHVAADLAAAARQAGAQRVLARSAFVRQLPDLLRALAGQGDAAAATE